MVFKNWRKRRSISQRRQNRQNNENPPDPKKELASLEATLDAPVSPSVEDALTRNKYQDPKSTTRSHSGVRQMAHHARPHQSHRVWLKWSDNFSKMKKLNSLKI